MSFTLSFLLFGHIKEFQLKNNLYLWLEIFFVHKQLNIVSIGDLHSYFYLVNVMQSTGMTAYRLLTSFDLMASFEVVKLLR